MHWDDRISPLRLRRSWSLLAAMALSAVAAWGSAASAADSRPNILLVFADDHAYQSIGAYGSKINQTPNIDRLAKEGILFSRCLVTNSICGPSRAVVLTGKYSHLNGVLDNAGGTVFDGSQQTFPKLLQQAGYQTAVIGKWHLKSDPVGFDHWSILIGQGTYYNPVLKTSAGTNVHTGYVTEVITDQALAWLDGGRDRSKPFMLMYQHKAPHREWAPGPKELNLYKDIKIPEPPTLFDDYAGRSSAAKGQEMSIAGHMTDKDLKFEAPKNLTLEQLATWNAAYAAENEAFRQANLSGKELVRWKYHRYLKDYLRCVSSIDANLGRVLKYLDDRGLAENTIVVYSSDQGFYLGEHGWFDKRWMYEESLRTPLLVRWPGVAKPGSECDALVSNLDFAEAFLDAAGAKIPADMQGRSLKPLVAGQTPSGWRKSFYYHYYEYPQPHAVQPHYGVRTARHKLMHFYRLKEWELFDLDRDPQELKSVYGEPGYADVQRELKAELSRLQLQFKDDEPEKPTAAELRSRSP